MKHLGWVLILGSLLIPLGLISRPAQANDAIAATADSPAAALEKARRLAVDGNYERALKLLAPFADPTPQNAALYSDYIVFQFWAGHPRKALALFESMPDALPRRPYLLRNIAKACLDLGESEKAARYYEQAVAQDPHDIIAKKGLILSLLRQKRFETAGARLQQWLKTHPEAVDLQLLQIEQQFRSGHYVDALRRLHTMASTDGIEPERSDRIRQSLVAAVPPEQHEHFREQLRNAADTGNSAAVSDYVSALVMSREYARALAYLDAASLSPEQLLPFGLYWTAWANFKTERFEKAEALFQLLTERAPAYARGPIGLAHVYAAAGQTDLALQTLEAVQARSRGDKLERLFALAYVYETAGRFAEAIAVYDKMLAEFPANKTAAKLRLFALSDMGATSEALQEAVAAFPDDTVLHRDIKARKAVNYIHWDEPEMAVKFLEVELEKDPDSLLRFEYIAALAAAKRPAEAIAVYETLEAEGVPVPPWVTAEAAEAYLAEKHPEKALALYELALSGNPDLWDARMGKFNALKDLRRFRAAEQELRQIEADTQPVLGSGRQKRVNPDLMDLHIARGWLLADEERLMEADAYFAALRKTAPASLDIRNGQAHVASWRGWNRKALDEFNYIASLDPAYLGAKPGEIVVLDALAQKETARRELSRMLAQHPRDPRFQRVRRQFAVDGMNALETQVLAQREDDGTNDIFMQADISSPLSLYTRLHAFTLWRRTWNDNLSAAQKAAGEDEPAYFRRVGLGIDHIFNSTWELRQQFSADYSEGGDFGSFTRLRITPDDHWRVDALVNTFSIDVPARARIQDITAVRTALETVYRKNERRQYSLLLERHWFSDDNNRDQVLAGVSQLLWVKNDWKMRLSGNVYYGANSEYDDPSIAYFNPKHAWGVSITHMTEQIVSLRYTRSFIHRLFLTAGNFKQYDYSNGVVASARYEQDHQFSDTHFLRWAVSVGHNIYDGDAVTLGAIELMYLWRF